MERVDPQPDVERIAMRAGERDLRHKARELAGRVEDDVVRQAENFGQVVALVGRAVRRDLTLIMLGGEQRFPQARSAHPVEILADHRSDPPHRKRLERGQNFDPGAVADVGEDGQVGAQLCRVHHERG